MNQPPLFVESIYDALRAIVGQLGGPKVVGARLWPAKSVDDARRQLLDCLNPDRHEKLDPEQIVMLFRLARLAGYHGAMEYFAAEAGYTKPSPIEPADEMAQLQRDFIASVKLQQQIAARLERVGVPASISRVA